MENDRLILDIGDGQPPRRRGSRRAEVPAAGAGI